MRARDLILPSFWRYLFSGRPSWRRVWCRLSDHKPGPVYYQSSPLATEPDMHCAGCGEDLG